MWHDLDSDESQAKIGEGVRILFASHRVTVTTPNFKISADDYCNDPEFQNVYGIGLKIQQHKHATAEHQTQLDKHRTFDIPEIEWTDP
eukprot:SAG11_NODE_28623_length_319_cov_1.577273_1_plen_87_part_10